MKRGVFWIGMLLLFGSQPCAADGGLGTRFGAREDSMAAVLIGERAGADSAAVYRGLDRPGKAQFLADFWRRHNALVLKFYYGYEMGRRYLTVSDAFFERGDLIPLRFKTGAVAPDSLMVADAVALFRRLVRALPEDLVAQCALGYGLLEQGQGVAAEQVFLKVIQKDKHFLAARHGRALACLIQNKRARRALDFFRETVSLDPDYAAALYDMAMCHLVMRSVDLDHYFGQVIKRFPDHYDAYFKLGAFYESLYYFNKAVEAFSKQVAVNPGHRAAREHLARVSLEMRYQNRRAHTQTELRDLARRDPQRYLPLLAAQYLEEKDFAQAQAAYARYLALLPDKERARYEDVSLLATEEERTALAMADSSEQADWLRLFWKKHDPTPTTPVNERRLEHYRRVYYARQNFSEGKQPWDMRGDVYIRFGHPDHRSWSDHLVFETDPKVIRVKDRLTELAHDALYEVVPSNHYQGVDRFASPALTQEMTEIRGFPVFPLPHQGSLFRDGASLNAKWESWIYANIGEGFEVTFFDALGDYDFEFPQPPVDSPNRPLWQHMAPEAVVGRVVAHTPSVYSYDYGGDPMPLYVSTADFAAPDAQSQVDVYLGVPWQALGVEKRGERYTARLKRMLVLFDGEGREVLRDSLDARASTDADEANPGTLWIDQAQARVRPGAYFLAVRVEAPAVGKLQIYRRDVSVAAFEKPALMLSDVEVAGRIAELGAERKGKFVKGDLEVVPLPSRTFAPGQPVYLYYEIYHLSRNDTGQTHYRVDYAVHGATSHARVRLLHSLGTLLGVVREGEGVRISYEQTGESATESVYVALDVGATDAAHLTISVTVTDLTRPGRPPATQDVDVVIGK